MFAEWKSNGIHSFLNTQYISFVSLDSIAVFFPLSIIDYVSQENIHGNTEFADYANCYLKQRRRASFENLKANYRGILHVF